MNRREFLKITSTGVLASLIPSNIFAKKQKSPNVILILTDDQGYGDLGYHGNKIINTPNLDKLFAESVDLINFHVSPTCAPTRASLMTGRYNDRTGVWHTIMGRELLRRDEITMADVFAANGYQMAIFGKWHLGDNYPFRPQDRGFQEVLVCGGGGVGQIPDYWGNDYFDDVYFHNEKPEKFEGYCTDIWFDNVINFIKKNKDQSFFAYIPTNAPHSPYNVPEKYSKPYEEKGMKNSRAKFYGMITNIDENIGRLVKELKKLGLFNNTILIFCGDNGTSSGVDLDKNGFPVGGFNAGMRGRKGSPYEGGHRAACSISWPNAGIKGGKSISRLTAHIDILPTLIDLCDLQQKPKEVRYDGKSLKPLLIGKTKNWTDRVLFVDNQRLEYLVKWKQFAVMTDRWRLVGNYGKGKTYRNFSLEPNQQLIKSPRKEIELYDIKIDPGQRHNLADKHPEIVNKLLQAYENWWKDISKRSDEYCRIIIGSEKENPTILTCHDWHGGRNEIPWNQRQIRQGFVANGFWAVEAARDGEYEFALRRWPIELDKGIGEGNPAREGVSGVENLPEEKILDIKGARLKIGDVDVKKSVPKDAKEAVFQVKLKKGKTRLQTWFTDAKSENRGAYYVYIKRL